MIPPTGTELALPTKANFEVMMRTNGGIDAILQRIEDEARAQAADLSTKKGRDAIASLAYKIAKSKTALDEAGKALNEDARAQINAVDAERRKIRDRLDKLKDEVRAQLTAWEAKEAARIDRHKANLERIRNAAPVEDTASAYRVLIATVEGYEIGDKWQEFIVDAAKAKDETLTRLRASLAVAEEREAQEAEIARLKAEALAREEADRQRREAEEAERVRVEKARVEAEAQAQREREKQEAAARATREAEERAAAELARAKAEAEAREAQLRREAEEAADRHRRDMEAAARRESEAAAAERARIDAQKRAEEEAAHKRAADQAHRENIHRAISDALRAMAGNASPERIADALMGGLIPHCVVRL